MKARTRNVLACLGALILALAGITAVVVVQESAGPHLGRYRDHNIQCITFSPDGGILASAEDRQIILWDVASGRSVGALYGNRPETASIEFSSDGQWLVGLEAGGRAITTWNMQTGEPIEAIPEGGELKAGSAFCPGSMQLANKDADSVVNIIDVTSGKTRQVLKSRAYGIANIYGLAFSPRNSLLAIQGWHRICFCDVTDGKIIGSLGIADWVLPTLMSFSPDSCSLVVKEGDGKLVVYDVARQQLQSQVPEDDVRAVAWGGANVFILGNNMIRVWNTDAPGTPTTLAEFRHPPTSLRASQHGRYVGCVINHHVLLWDMTTRQRIHGNKPYYLGPISLRSDDEEVSSGSIVVGSTRRYSADGKEVPRVEPVFKKGEAAMNEAD
jgi:WD40 repeat protein